MTDDQWRIAVHEAGHAVAALEFGGQCDGLVLLPEGGGLAGVEALGNGRDAYMIAAGPESERLAEEYDAPEAMRPSGELLTVNEIESTSIFRSAPYLAAQLAKPENKRKSWVSDERHLALWAITGHEHDPESWARRLDFVRHVAREVVDRNVETIIRLARALYEAGSLSADEILAIAQPQKANA